MKLKARKNSTVHCCVKKFCKKKLLRYLYKKTFSSQMNTNMICLYLFVTKEFFVKKSKQLISSSIVRTKCTQEKSHKAILRR